MEHRVTVWTHRHEVLDRIGAIALASLSKRDKVVDVDKVLAEPPVELLKVNTTGAASKAEMTKARCARLWVPLEAIHEHLSNPSLEPNVSRIDFVGERGGDASSRALAGLLMPTEWGAFRAVLRPPALQCAVLPAPSQKLV